MPVSIRGISYPLPKEDGRSGPTGIEIDEVETYFGVDYQDLMALLIDSEDGKPAPVAKKGCTKNRALYSLVWICVNRVDPSFTIADAMQFGVDELDFSTEETKAVESPKDTESPVEESVPE